MRTRRERVSHTAYDSREHTYLAEEDQHHCNDAHMSILATYPHIGPILRVHPLNTRQAHEKELTNLPLT